MDGTVNLAKIEKDIRKAKVTSKDIIISEDAERAILAVKKAESLTKDAVAYIKEVVKDALDKYNMKTLRGKYVTVTVSAPKEVGKYVVDEDAEEQFYTKEYKIVPNKDTIEAYVEEVGQLPYGVHIKETKPAVSIRLKKDADDIFNM